MPCHHNTISPHHRTPTPTSRPDATPDATGARVAAGPPPTLATTLTRRVDVRTPSRRRPDTVTPLAVPVYRTRLQYPLVGRHPEDKKCESDTGHMPYLEDSTPDPTQPRRPDFSRAPGVGFALTPTPPTPLGRRRPAHRIQVPDRCRYIEDRTPGQSQQQAQATCDTLRTGHIAPSPSPSQLLAFRRA